MKKEQEYLQEKIKQEDEYIYNHFHSPKAFILNIITLGFYGMTQYVNYLKRIGLY